MDWLNEAIYLSWLTDDHPVERSYAGDQVEKTKRLGAGTLIYFVQVGGPVIYDSLLAPRTPRLDFDLLRGLLDDTHATNLHFVAGWLGTLPANAREARQHPDWIMRGPKGEALGFVCYNSPYRDFLFAQLTELLANYEVDGLYFDQLPTGCFCPYCQAQFESMFGRPMAFDPQMPFNNWAGDIFGEAEHATSGLFSGGKQSAFRRFAQAKKKAFLWRVRQIINQTRPDAALLTNHLLDVEALDGAEYIDAPMPEVHARGDVRQALEVSARRTLTSLYSGGKPTWGLTKYDNFGPRSMPLAHALVTMADSVANGNAIILRDQDCLETDTPEARSSVYHAMSELCAIHQELRRVEPVHYAALLHSLPSVLASEAACEESFYGAYQLLIEQHLPFEIITEQQMLNGALDDKRVLVLSDTVVISPMLLGVIDMFVRQGGGLVVTGLSGARQADGMWSMPGALHRLLGVKVVNTISQGLREPHSLSSDVPVPSQHPTNFFYGRTRDISHPVLGRLRSTLLDWESEVIQLEVEQDATVLADVLAFDQQRLMSENFNRRMAFPGNAQTPLMVTREVEKGRCVYVAAPLYRTAVRATCEEWDELLENAVRWAAGKPPVIDIDDVPTHLRVTARRGNGVHSVFFTNLNIVSFGRGIRNYYPIPPFDLRWRLNGEHVTAVEDHEGTALSFHQEGDTIIVNIPRIDVYKLIRLHWDGFSHELEKNES